MYLASLVRNAMKNDSIVTAYVYGEMGVGKTSYALWVAREVLGGWEVVLDHLFFRPEEVIRAVIREARRGGKLPIIIMDDAGTWLDRMTWWEREKVSFMKFFNLIRSVAHSIIFTTPSEELPKQVANKCFIRVSVRRVTNEELESIYGDASVLVKTAKEHGVKPLFSLATGYVVKTLPSFMLQVKKEFYDAFPTHYPDNIFREYEVMRRKAVLSLLRMWEAEMRSKALNDAVQMLSEGARKSEIVKRLIAYGIPRSTAYRLLGRLESMTNRST
ncbi:MAG: AAA family ATPase [Zestosphaera sp.]